MNIQNVPPRRSRSGRTETSRLVSASLFELDVFIIRVLLRHNKDPSIKENKRGLAVGTPVCYLPSGVPHTPSTPRLWRLALRFDHFLSFGSALTLLLHCLLTNDLVHYHQTHTCLSH